MKGSSFFPDGACCRARKANPRAFERALKHSCLIHSAVPRLDFYQCLIYICINMHLSYKLKFNNLGNSIVSTKHILDTKCKLVGCSILRLLL